MTLIKSISGIRGTIGGKVNQGLTPLDAVKFASAYGTWLIRRNPDSKWKLKEDFLTNIKITQQKILKDYSKMVKPGGKLVYATCSILNSENTKQIKDFLKSENGKEFKFEKSI